MRKIVVFLFILFVSVTPVQAARSLSITSDKSSLFGSEEMLITASPSGFASTEAVFIKGAFYQDGSTNYFGFTQNGDNWIKNGDSSQNQPQVKISDWDGNIRVKCDFGDSGYKGEGDYKFKMGFYYTTGSGTVSSVNWSSNSLTVGISEPDPTPTTTPLPTNTPTSIPTKIPTPTSLPTKTPISTPKATPTTTPIESNGESVSTKSGSVLGLEFISPSPDTGTNPSDNKNKPAIIAFVLVGLGAVFIGISVYLGVKTSKHSELQNDI